MVRGFESTGYLVSSVRAHSFEGTGVQGTGR